MAFAKSSLENAPAKPPTFPRGPDRDYGDQIRGASFPPDMAPAGSDWVRGTSYLMRNPRTGASFAARLLCTGLSGRFASFPLGAIRRERWLGRRTRHAFLADARPNLHRRNATLFRKRVLVRFVEARTVGPTFGQRECGVGRRDFGSWSPAHTSESEPSVRSRSLLRQEAL